MNFRIVKTVFLCVFLFAASQCSAQNIFFSDVPENLISRPGQKRVIVPASYRSLQLNKTGLLNFLNIVPSEKNIVVPGAEPVIEIPMPDGGRTRFRIWESSVMEPALAARFPGIKTFSGQGIDDPSANLKLDFTPDGFHAMIISSLNGAVFVDPYAKGNTSNYISYHKKDFKKSSSFFELPPIKNLMGGNNPLSLESVQAVNCVGTQLRTYRLALAATGEYTVSQGGTIAQALAAEATTLNRVNGVYERELAIRMVLVANNDLLIYTDGTTDPYSNNDGFAMLNENQNNTTSIIGNGNYDIGHVFSTGGGGIANVGVVCVTNQKARGVTGLAVPVGDPFDIDYVAHEMGHQFGANHTFNSSSSSCGGNGYSLTNAEPGSGSTIMAYAGICGPDNLQPNSDAQFHAVSFNEITDFSINGPGSSCAVPSATGNIPPVVNAGLDYIIPKSTPFILSGGASDANGDALTFSWEQINVGGPFGDWNNPSLDAPLFRSFVPVSSPVRFFPKLSDVINNTTTVGEFLPTYSRTINFRLTARDNRAGGGGVCFDETAVTVADNAGPFLVSFPNAAGITWLVNDFKTITWDPAGTGAAPISCANVKIELSTDGGNSFPITILASTPNDGAEEIQVPNNTSAFARIRISAVGNIFYDISNANFSIQNPAAPDFVFNNPAPVAICGSTSGSVDLKTASQVGFSTNINLSATGNPPGTTVTFGTNPVSPGGTTTVTLNNTGSLAIGTYNITVNGIAGTSNKSRIISFVVNNIPAATGMLIAPANNAIGVITQPSFNWAAIPGAGSYILEIATNSGFSPVTQTVTNIKTLPFNLSNPLAENTVYYWRVTTTNICGTSNVSATGIFKTGVTVCNSISSTDIPRSIPELGTPTVTSVLTVPAGSGVTISDLNVVGLTGTHSYVSDITVSLTSPKGTTVVLFDQACNDEADFNINLDDEALLSDFPCPPTGNQTAKPQTPLSAFDGENSEGVWTLTVKDNYELDGGSLNGWGLAINCSFAATPIVLAPWTQLCPPTAGTTLTAGITGSVYQWQVNTGSGFINIVNDANYSGVNTGTLQINNVPSSWNGYQYRSVVDGNNSTVFTLGFTSYWLGSVSSAWENPANWSCNGIPDGNTDVIVNSGNVVVNSAAFCRSIKVNPGSQITVNAPYTITVTH